MNKKQKTKNAVYAILRLKQMTGIGPAYPAWKAGVLPLNYICKCSPRIYNRGDRIWTCDFLLPKQALYQAEPHPADKFPCRFLQTQNELYPDV